MDTPCPISVRSDGSPSSRADAPVARMSAFVSCTAVPSRTMNGCDPSSTAVTSPLMISVPNRSACARISAIRSGPMIPPRYPGKFSTMVVSIN